MKNYVIYINDHSGSMQGAKANAAIKDYNANIAAVVGAATREMLDTVVSVTAIGLPSKHGFATNVQRQVMVSNPHVLKAVTSWPTPGSTPLYDALVDTVKYHQELPDAGSEDVSFLVIITTDGEEYGSLVYSKSEVKDTIRKLQDTGRWTFVARVDRGSAHRMTALGIPADNVQEWDGNSAESLAKTTAATTAATDAYFTARATGSTASRSSNTFYANAAAVNTAALVDVSAKTSVYQVGQDQMGMLIKDFILTKRMEYLIGAAFYQLTKTESRVSPTKLILIREKATGKVFAGPDARKMLGLDTVNNARLHPGDHGQYEIYIQSESWNRKLVAGSLVLYWTEKGRPMTQADIDKYAPVVPVVLQGLPVAPTNKPTPSPIPVAKKVPDLNYINGKQVLGTFDTREDGRQHGRRLNPIRYVQDITDFPGMALHNGARWFLFV